jgi:membrane-associated phospholipid phosphatase
MKPTLYSILFAIASVAVAQPLVEPNAGSWKTWVLSSGSQLRTPAPPDAAASASELAFLKALRTSVNDVARQQIAYWDQGPPTYHWVQWLQQRLGITSPPTTTSVRQMALLNVAMYDALVATWDSKYAYNRPLPSQLDPTFQTLVQPIGAPSYPNDFAAAAGAAAAVLSYLYPADTAALQDLAAEAARSRLYAGVAYPSDYFAGLQLGQQVAALVVQRAKADNSDSVFTGAIPTGPGFWVGTNPACPTCGTWKPWLLSSGSQFRPGPPPAYNSPEKLADLAGMKALPRAFADQAAAFYWQTPTGAVLDWYNQVHVAVFEDKLDTNPPRVARAFALMSVAHYDAMVACWDGKYTYWAARPFMLDPTLTTLFATPNHPSYPAAHATLSTSIAEMMAYLFPTRADVFRSEAVAAGVSRRVAGIHFQSDLDAGNILGKQVAQVVIGWANQDGSTR